MPRVKIPDGSVRQVEPSWGGKLSGFTLLFEALVLILCQQMTFAAAARLVGESRHRVAAICERGLSHCNLYSGCPLVRVGAAVFAQCVGSSM